MNFKTKDYIINIHYNFSAIIYLIESIELDNSEYVLRSLGFYSANSNRITFYNYKAIGKEKSDFIDEHFALLPEHVLKQLNKLLTFL